MLISFDTDDPVAIGQVGGKAASLIQLQQMGANVPGGVVLTTEFFKTWLKEIEAGAEWRKALDILKEYGPGQLDLDNRARLAQACDQVKASAGRLALTPTQQDVLGTVAAMGAGPFAVRSSSPEEDLSGASFAGQYETVLDTKAEDVESAIRTCFASCLDSRVLLYKQEMQFERMTPTIAVVVQQQVASEMSGVAFSLNPLTNDYDEVLINASWGLGEALVSGDITPDSVVVNVATGEILEHRIGNKGGDRAEQACLTESQIAKLSDETKRIESIYEMPVDIEWAYANGQLHMLQARPITTHIPMIAEMLSEPGKQRHLYFDGYLTDGITMSCPVSPMGTELMVLLLRYMIDWMGIPLEKQRFEDYGMYVNGGRMYLDISAYMHLMGKGKAMARQAKAMDPTMAAVFTSPELEQYRPAEVPTHLKRRALFPHLPRMLWRARRAFKVVIRAMFKRETFDAECRQILADFDKHVRSPIEFERPLTDVIFEEMMHCGTKTMDSSYPAFMIFYIAIFRLKALVDAKDPEQVTLVDALLGGYEEDMVVNMGHRLFDMAQLLPVEAFDNLEELQRGIETRSLPNDFLSRWDDFVFSYGHRGPLEMDLLNPRYADAPQVILQQIAGLARAGGSFNPHDMQAKKVREREAAYGRLLELLPARKVRKLKKLYADVLAYSGMRETFKHHLAQIYHRLRIHVLERAERFVAEGRLDRVEDIFQLPFAAVDRAHADSSVDLRALVAEKGALFRQQVAQVRHFPLNLDSRGRIFRPQIHREDLPEGTIAGAAVSAGVASGPIKVLNDPFEKELEPGDVLVAVTTDPGWTPLFINAAAVLLEVGGELQHGALVAREYGKPCVSGIADVTNRFEDGQMVEVDGDAGLVRLI